MVMKKFVTMWENELTEADSAKPGSLNSDVESFAKPESGAKSIGHYTQVFLSVMLSVSQSINQSVSLQVVWATSWQVGCGYADCGRWKYVLCQYHFG